MGNMKILIVDDEASIRRFLRVTLTSQAYMVLEASTGNEALSRVAEDKPDIVILDLGLPDIDGVEVTRLLREWTQMPIIILSVRGAESDKIAALDAGADDYLTKPFGVGELLARLRAALRRTARIAGEPFFTSGNLKVDLSRRLVTMENHEVQLTPHEYGLLRVLVTHAGKVLTHRYLLREVWGAEYGDEFHMLHVNISNLRRKIESDPARPQLIITEPGVGYRLRLGE
ncbi:MAG TPA: response regulator [Dehalococcoidales bacterium]|nr:response regulator [Dehalococcoidales bacterium]